MKLTSSYKVKINKTGFDKKAIRDTSILYRNAVSFFISLIEKEWSYISGSKFDVTKLVENLSHKTKDNPIPKYDFDAYLYKFPSYLRRTAISEAYGLVASYYSNLDAYNINKKKKLQRNKKSTKSIFREINNCQDRLEIYICKEIIKFALDNDAKAIVFEHLSPYMKAKGKYKEKLHLWRKKGIANRLSHMAHLNGLRYSTV